MKQKSAYIHGIATTVPQYRFEQPFVLDFVTKLLGDTKQKQTFLKRVYAGTAIDTRYSVIGDYGRNPEDFTFYPKNETLTPEPSTAKRNDLFIAESKTLSIDAVKKLLLQSSSIDPTSITHLITVSCTGFSAPGFDFHLIKELGLAEDINRFHLGFMGCYAAFPAMKLARNIALSEENAKILIVTVELCSLHFQQKYEPDTIVANAIFADGVSAALISADQNDSWGNSLKLNQFYSRVIDSSENEMAWQIGETGFDMKLSAYVPRLIEGNIGSIMDSLFEKCKISRHQIDLWAIHPGGRAILDKLHESLGLQKSDLQISYDVLRNYGNMSSSTIMFVLKELLENSSTGTVFAAGFGPGLTVESAIMEKLC